MTSVMRAPTMAEAALSLRLSGASYQEVAETVGYKSPELARKAVNTVLAAGVRDEDRARHRELATNRLSSLLKAIWEKAHNTEATDQLPAVRAARELVREIATLQGAYMPQEVIIHNPTSSQLMEWINKVAQIQMPDVKEIDPFDVVDAEVVDEVEE